MTSFEVKYGAQRDVELHEFFGVQAAREVAEALRVDGSGLLDQYPDILAEKFDHIATLTTFFITPLVFVGGVFTSMQFLPPLVQRVSLFNPMFYMIDAFRFSFTGHSDVPLALSVGIVAALTAAALGTALRMTATGYKLRV